MASKALPKKKPKTAKRKKTRLDSKKRAEKRAERHYRQKNESAYQLVASRQEIGPLPAVKNPERKAAALTSLRVYCETYKRAKFFWEWSNDHLKAIARMEECATRGGLFAIAMTRGGGKSELSRAAAEWAALSGRRRFIVLIGAKADLAEDLLKSVKETLERNDLLAEDFPEVCYPIRCLENRANRCKGQKLDGKPTRMEWGADEIKLPEVPGAASSGAIIASCSIEGGIRGLNRPAPDGGSLRPDFVIPDDVQTRESAKSPSQTRDRELIIEGDVLELVGPNVNVGCIMPCTVIYPNDLADRFIDRKAHPEFRGERFKALYSFPAKLDLWARYAEIRAEAMRADGDGSEATAFYQANREDMDAGAVVAWPQRMKPGEVSGLQSAMNVYLSKPRTFAAEWQNEPLAARADESDVVQLGEADLARKINNLPRGIVPRECSRLTAFIDVQAECLFWAVCAWTAEAFGGALVDYGVFPPQPRDVFEAQQLDVRLSDKYKHLERKARIYAALAELVPQVMGRVWAQDGAGGGSTIAKGLIDAGFETEAVHDAISRSPLRPLLSPSMGRGLKADNKPMNQYRRGPGDLVGWNWRVDANPTGKGRFVSISTYPWKSFVADAILAAPGASGSFYLPGKSIAEHPLLSLHLLSEMGIGTSGPYGRVVVWKRRPDRTEEHWWDCIVGCHVAASMLGLTFSAAAAAGDMSSPPTTQRPSATTADYEKARRDFERRRGY